jgi:hypothetical protein
MKGKHHLGKLCVDGIIMGLKKIYVKSMDWDVCDSG